MSYILAFLQTVTPPVNGGDAAAVGAIVAVSAGLVKGLDYVIDRRGKRRREAREDRLEKAITAIGTKVDASQVATDRRCDSIERQVATLSAHIIGPDGENGIRGDLREVKKRVIGLEERERDRLAASVGIKDRRASL